MSSATVDKNIAELYKKIDEIVGKKPPRFGNLRAGNLRALLDRARGTRRAKR